VEGEERISCRGVAYLVWAFGQCGYRNRAFLTTAVEAYFEDFKRLTPFESSRLLQVSRGTGCLCTTCCYVITGSSMATACCMPPTRHY
jgi:hypothetical protein